MTGTGRVRRLAILAAVLIAAGCGGSILPHDSHGSAATFQTFEQVQAAYDSVTPDKTTAAELTALGFDTKASLNVEILANPGINDRFVVQGARNLNSVPVSVQKCMAAQERCKAYVFHPQHLESHHVGNAILDVTGFKKDVVRTGWSADVMVVLLDDVVIYKIMSGRPRIEDRHNSVQPLGPLQNIGKTGSESGRRKDP